MSSVQLALIALISGSLSAPLILSGLQSMRARQTVSEHIQEHAHKQGTPTMGGLIVLFGVSVALAFGWHSDFGSLAVLLVAFGIVGFADDYVVPKMMPGKRGLGWMPKLGLELGGAIIAGMLLGFDSLSLGIFVFLVLFLSNAYNFSDGLDGLSGGLGILLALGFMALSPASAPVCAILIGAMIPFLFLNAPPARIFMGDVGALPIGALFAWVTARALNLGHGGTGTGHAAAIAILLLIMFAEIVPVPLQIFWVKAFKRRLFAFKTPIHHAFQAAGWPETRIVWSFHLVQAILILISMAVAQAW